MKTEVLNRDLLSELSDIGIEEAIKRLDDTRGVYLSRGYFNMRLSLESDYDYVELVLTGDRELNEVERAKFLPYTEKECVKRISSLSKNPDLKRMVYEKLKEEFESQ